MKLVVVGINHKDTPLEIREKGSFIHRTLNEGIRTLLNENDIAEVIILSTCNRSEIYVATRNVDAAGEILKGFYLSEKSDQLEPYLFVKKERAAMVHLYEVVTGLDSMILGEDQILGQVKDALEKSQAIKGCGKYLTKMFREAITFSKKVKTVYKISETPLSLSSTAIKHIKRQYPEDYGDKKILIIGSGKMGELALRYMKAEGFQNPYMTNRTFHNMDKCEAIHENVKMIHYENRYQVIPEMDVIISATASPHVILKAAEMPQLDKPLIVIDLALPRDVDEAVGNIPGAELLTIDDFKEIIDETMVYRMKVAEKIAAEIQEEIDGLILWVTHAKVDNMVQDLNETSRKLAEETIENLCGRLSLTEKEETYLAKIVRSKFREMVMPPIKQLKSLNTEEEIIRMEKTVAYLFSGRPEAALGDQK
ncbi:glutamyl-tRNA reductase [Acetobacterium paludosum]|uniref:Glutamyl-tRNA reductase n=1 Tax=Acetobacterium paludosum TaxID=52693 RepID=A0A923HQF6_9FIRM|nr:glutamyl-tRNA reductase [Acetobacterium paludosum]MBC3886838.1 glutamyl-tRNA reductase [Acetobacterium paludosum]